MIFLINTALVLAILVLLCALIPLVLIVGGIAWFVIDAIMWCELPSLFKSNDNKGD